LQATPALDTYLTVDAFPESNLSNNRIRIRPFGGAATITGLLPQGTAVDFAGNHFIAMQGKIFVAKANASGIIIAYAGNGALAVSRGGGHQATRALLFAIQPY
jgi:hypothetical protein